jgi:hypothetical protein
MRIIRLQAEGFKRLVAVDISPEGDLIEIRGNNGEGKSSVLDAIFAALAGKEAAPVKPVRTGEEYALITLDLGDLKVTRYFGEDGTTKLKVENADGAVFTQGQTMLDALVGSISFDPLEFARMEPKAQAVEIRRLVKLDVDLDDLAAKDKADYEARREVNRDASGLKSRVEAIVVPADLPAEAPNKDAIVAELSNAAETNSAIERERMRREGEISRAGGIRTGAGRKRERVFELRKEIERLEGEADKAEREADEVLAAVEGLPPLGDPVDVTEVRARLGEAERLVELIRRRDERARLSADFRALKERSEALTQAMADRATAREKALASAEMPVAGLGFATIGDDLVVTFNGEPFSQASSAEQLRVSTAIAMAANPKLRVLRVKEGSLLDKTSLALLAGMAKDNDFQIWGEFVGDEGAGIIMEAGAVKGAPEPERVEPPKRRKKAGEGGDDEGGGGAPQAGENKPQAAGKPAEAPKRKRPAAMGEIVTPPADRLL